jgi:SLT domain-containing protein
MITGTPLAWGAAIQRRIMFESGGNPNAINLWDSNAMAGDPSRGLMQTIGSTFNAFHQPGTSNNIYDPVANIAAAINYIKSRYGSIFAIDPPVQGYETGAWNIARDQLARLHRGEMVIPENVAKDIRAGGGGVSERALVRALSGLEFRFDGDGLARLVSARQAAVAAKGPRR